MAYVTYDDYLNTFHGQPIEQDAFDRLAETASDVIDAIVMRPITSDVDAAQLSKAAAYEVEYIHAQGGLQAVTGFAAAQQQTTEKLDEYSITSGQSESAARHQSAFGGIPVSPLTVQILRNLGLMCRWYYAGRGDRLGD